MVEDPGYAFTVPDTWSSLDRGRIVLVSQGATIPENPTIERAIKGAITSLVGADAIAIEVPGVGRMNVADTGHQATDARTSISELRDALVALYKAVPQRTGEVTSDSYRWGPLRGFWVTVNLEAVNAAGSTSIAYVIEYVVVDKDWTYYIAMTAEKQRFGLWRTIADSFEVLP